ncbi:hypothetical protein FRB99_005266 [Tulasnella sp. 403]|nr:hypothetical protein FRB99_005266 [Tulasnella sp. 403]
MDKNNLPSNDNSSLYTLPDIELDPANHEDLWNTHSATFHATVDFFDPVQQTPGSPASENSPWTLPEAWLSDTALASDSPQAEYHTLPLLSELPPIPTIPSPPSIYLTFDTDPESFSPSFTLDLPGSAKTSYIDLPPAVPFNLQPRVPSASPSPVSGSTSSSPLTSLSSLDSSSSEALSSPDITITPARRKQPKRLAAAKRPCRESTADTSPTGIITFQLDVNSPDGVCPTQAREPDLAEIRRRLTKLMIITPRT